MNTLNSLRGSRSTLSRRRDKPWRISVQLSDQKASTPDTEAGSQQASQIVQLLQAGAVYLTGGRDKRGGPILQFPSDSKVDDLSVDDLSTCLTYLTRLPSAESLNKGFTIIIDNRHGNLTTSVKKLLSAAEAVLHGSIQGAYVVQTERQKLTQSFRRERPHFQFPVHYVTLSKLLDICSPSQLTYDFGGTLPYDHELWLQNRLLIEKYVHDVDTAVWNLDRLHSRLVESLDSNDRTTVRELLAEQMRDDNSLLNRAKPLLEHGQQLERKLEVESERAYHSQDRSSYSVDCTLAMSTVKQHTNLLASTLDRFDALHRESMMEIIWKRQLSELEQAMKTIVDWILGPAEKLLASQTDIGDSFRAADELRKQHEQLELKCSESYGTYAELRHRVAEVVSSESVEPDKAVDLEAQRDYMDMVCRSFASRLERRRNLVISSARFHRLVQQLSLELDELLDWLMTDVVADDVTAAETALRELDDKCEKLVAKAGQALSEGQILLDQLLLPVKDAKGQDVTPADRKQQVALVDDVVGSVQQRRGRCDELAELRRLKLQQLLQLRTCERDIDQAIAWLLELCDIASQSRPSISHTVQEAQECEQEQKKLEGTAESTYEYGKQLLQAALALRRSMNLDLEPNTEQAARLAHAWRLLSKGVNEQSVRNNSAALFLQQSDDLLQRVEDLLVTVSRTLNMELGVEQLVQHFSETKNDLELTHNHIADEGLQLVDRLNQPILIDDRSATID